MSVFILEQKVVPNRSVVSAKVDGEAVLLNIDTGIYFGLNAVGTCIWEFLVEGKCQDEILDQMVAEYDVERERLESDFTSFMDLLLENDLVRPLNGYR